ncbi:MAG: mobilome CxxCx(11)CxxC protein [Rhizomicrobium sp.]
MPDATLAVADDHANAKQLWTQAKEAFGTAAIFEKRARTYRRLVRGLTFYGLAIPLIIGAIVLGNLAANRPLAIAIYIASALGAVQVVISLWSVVADWTGSLEYSAAANENNIRLSADLKALGIEANKPAAGFDVRRAKAVEAYNGQVAQDQRTLASDDEKVYGYRAALLQFRSRCTLCDKEPPSMKMPFWKSNRCERCGGPKKR